MRYQQYVASAWLVIGIILVGVLQYSLIPLLPAGLSLIQLPIVMIVSLCFAMSPAVGMYAALALGVLLDTMSPEPYGIYIVSFLGCAIAVSILLRTVITNRSLYSIVVLTAVASVLFMVIFTVIAKTTALFTGNAFSHHWTFYLQAALYTALWHSLAVAAGYLIIFRLQKKL